MAEAIAKDMVDRGAMPGLGDLFVASAGIAAFGGQPVSPETLAALRAIGIEHRGSAKRLTAEMIRRADVVLAMSEEHVTQARKLVAGEPAEQSKIQRLDPGGDIEDPIGMGQGAYHDLASQLGGFLPRRIAEVLPKVGA